MTYSRVPRIGTLSALLQNTILKGKYEITKNEIVYRISRLVPFSLLPVEVSLKRNAEGKFDMMIIDLETVAGNHYMGSFEPGSSGTVDTDSVFVAKRSKGAEGFHYEFVPEHSRRMHGNAGFLKPLLREKIEDIISHGLAQKGDFSPGMAKYLGL